MYKFLIVVLVASLSAPSLARPDGAPASVCKDQIPHHGSNAPQTSLSPFSLVTSSTSVNAGQTVTVQIVPKDGSAFRGFLIQARDKLKNTEIIGTFAQPASSDSFKLITCATERDSVTHNSNIDRTGLTLNWVAPQGFSGNVIFTATVVKSYDQFWAGITSATISVVSA